MNLKILLSKMPELAMATAEVLMIALAVMFVSVVLILSNAWAAVVTLLNPKYQKASRRKSMPKAPENHQNIPEGTNNVEQKDRKELVNHD